MTSDRPYRRALHRGGGAGRARAPRRHAVLPDDGRRAAARARPRRRPRPRRRRRRRRPSCRAMRPDRPLEAELRALITISSAVGGGAPLRRGARRGRRAGVLRAARRQHLDQPLGARARLDAHARQRRRAASRGGSPADARDVAADPLDRTLVDRGEPYVIALDRRRRCPAEERDFLERIGRGSALAARSATAIGSGACWRRTPRPARRRSAPRTSASPRRCARRSRRRSAARELFSRLETLAYRGPADAAAEPARARRPARGGRRARRRRPDGELALLFCDLDGAQGGQRPPRPRRRRPRADRDRRGARRRRPRRTPAPSPAGSAATSSAS